MSYIKNTWQKGDVVTAEKLNHIEDYLASVVSSKQYEETNWQTGDIVTAEKLNNIENGVESYASILAAYIDRSIENMVVPNGVTLIGPLAFNGCSDLTEVSIPSSVTSIGTSAFDSCTGLTEVSISSSVTSIGSSAFSGCTGLTEVYIPSSVTSIGDFAFQGCTGVINCGFAEGAVPDAPWGADDATINYNVPAPNAE